MASKHSGVGAASRSSSDKQQHTSRHHHHHHHHKSDRSSKSNELHTLQSDDKSTSSLVKFDDSDDHVLAVLHSDALTYQDMESLVTDLNPQRAQDILMSYRILSTLTQYLEETDSWSFNLLNNYDFQNNVRQFDLDVAIVVGKRSEHLLAEIHAWNIPKLKRMVTRFSAYYSDEATILTVLVFRIVSNYSDLEFTLQLALSRATLIKIHYEMAGLFSKLPGGIEGNTSDNASRQKNADLVTAYRQFVSQLLDEIETTPFESVQQELFQVVRDLKSMFSKFSDSQMMNTLESDSPRDETFFDLSNSVPSLSQSQSSRLPPLNEDQRIDMSDSHMSSSTTFSEASRSATISEGLPAMMQAFELARNREELHKYHQQLRPPTTASGSNASPPETPVRSSRVSDTYKSPASNSMYSSSILSSPPSSISTGTVRSVSQWGGSTTPTPTPQHSSSSLSRPPTTPENNSGAMQVKMISNRMMIQVNGKYVDMQEWAASQNTSSRNSSSSSTAGSVMREHVPPMHIVMPHSAPHSAAGSSSSSVPHGYGLGMIFQPFLRPAGKAVVGSTFKVKEDDQSDQDQQQQVATRNGNSTRMQKSTSIDGILAQAAESDSSQENFNYSAGSNGSSSSLTKPMPALRTPAMPRKPTVASMASTAGPKPAASSSATAALNSSSWIRNVLGSAEEQFGKNYTTTMGPGF